MNTMKSKPTQPVHIKDLTPDPQNARAHNPRNVGLIVDTLHEVGAGRSIVIDENNVILAGNATVEAAAEAGIVKLKVVEADGETLIAVRRTGLTAKQKVVLAVGDNRSSELATWHVPNLTTVIEPFTPDERYKLGFTPKELEALTNTPTAPESSPQEDEKHPAEFQCPQCGWEWSGIAKQSNPESPAS